LIEKCAWIICSKNFADFQLLKLIVLPLHGKDTALEPDHYAAHGKTLRTAKGFVKAAATEFAVAFAIRGDWA
jgi:hypothetical protein